LRITFDRDIFQGDTQQRLRIEQDSSGYRIPAVLTEERWDELFIERTDIPGFFAEEWRNIGNVLYHKGSNGAVTGSGNTLNPDTTIKYVLNFEYDTRENAAGTVLGRDMTDIRNGLRAAEALNFFAMDREITIVNNRTLQINLNDQNQGRALPVKGTAYRMTIPNGFVKDFLENPNGNSNTGFDSTLTSELRITGIENPVIRINKGLIETITGSGDARQAQQPLQTQFKIDCRTPGSTMRYRTRQTTDNIGQLIMRRSTTNGNISNAGLITGTGTSAVSRNLPNLGSQTFDNDGTLSFQATRRRPQSGNITNQYWNPATESFQASAAGGAFINGLNFWTPMGSWPILPAAGNYTAGTSVSIGDLNYNTGGMEIHIHAQSAVNNSWPVNNTSAGNAYEAAYRSVFVFSNIGINGNGSLRNLGVQSQAGATAAPFSNTARTRVYVRGGNTTSFDPTIPDFPVSRDRSLARKARLLTPFNIVTPTAAVNGFGPAPNYNTGSITNANIVTTGFNSNGQYLWVWVTWGVNVPAYIDVFAGEMAGEAAGLYSHHHVETKDFYGTWTYSKEHYAVLPGRTTIVETRSAYGTQADGGHAADVLLGSVVRSPPPRDLSP
jgi:hypothetical protein